MLYMYLPCVFGGYCEVTEVTFLLCVFQVTWTCGNEAKGKVCVAMQ
jgi:hypothetical protein